MRRNARRRDVIRGYILQRFYPHADDFQLDAGGCAGDLRE